MKVPKNGMSFYQTIGNITHGEVAICYILKALKALLTKERELLKISAEAYDEGTVVLMSEYIVQQEKPVWM